VHDKYITHCVLKISHLLAILALIIFLHSTYPNPHSIYDVADHTDAYAIAAKIIHVHFELILQFLLATTPVNIYNIMHCWLAAWRNYHVGINSRFTNSVEILCVLYLSSQAGCMEQFKEVVFEIHCTNRKYQA